MAPSTQHAVREIPLPAALRATVTVSIDVEDWHQLVTRRFSGALPDCSANVDAQTDRVLETLDTHGIRATCFILGLVAREKPALVRRIADAGHEIASHGMMHVPFQQLSRDEVRAELADSRKLLSDIVSADVVGFRAPEFSIVEDNRWVLEEVAAAGYRYDSSIFPVRHRRYGIRTFARTPSLMTLPSGRTLWELPIGTLPTVYGNLPIAGGGYFRLLPGLVLERVFRSLARDGDHAMLYFHPYEFTRSRLALEAAAMPRSPKAKARARMWLALQAIGRGRLPGRVERVLRSSRSVRGVDLVDALETALTERSAPARPQEKA